MKLSQYWYLGLLFVYLLLAPGLLTATQVAVPQRVDVKSDYQRSYYGESVSPVTSISNYWQNTALKIRPVEGYQLNDWSHFLDQSKSSVSTIDGKRCLDFKVKTDVSVRLSTRSKQYSSDTIRCLGRADNGSLVSSSDSIRFIVNRSAPEHRIGGLNTCLSRHASSDQDSGKLRIWANKGNHPMSEVFFQFPEGKNKVCFRVAFDIPESLKIRSMDLLLFGSPGDVKTPLKLHEFSYFSQPAIPSGDKSQEDSRMFPLNINDDFVLKSIEFSHPAPHILKATVDYEYSSRANEELWIVIDGKRNGHRLNFGMKPGVFEPGGQTTSTTSSYLTRDPQYDGQDPPRRIELDEVYLKIYRGPSDYLKEWAMPYQSKMTIKQSYENDPDRPDDPTVNNFGSVRMELTDDTEALVHVDYDYRSDHGTPIRVKAFAYEDGRKLSGWGYLPGMVRKYGSGTTTAKLSYSRWDKGDLPQTTDQLELQMSTYRTGVFYKKIIDFPITWGGTKKTFHYNPSNK